MFFSQTPVSPPSAPGGLWRPRGGFFITSLPHYLFILHYPISYNRQPRTHAPALLNYLITSQQLAVRRTRKQKNKKNTSGRFRAVVDMPDSESDRGHTWDTRGSFPIGCAMIAPHASVHLASVLCHVSTVCQQIHA